jgi:hypothetical protein
MNPKKPVLTVWYGKMPESNGRNNWTATLRGNGEDFNLDRSEYPHRVRYAADVVRHHIVDTNPDMKISRSRA